MYNLIWRKRFEGQVYDRAIVILAQKCKDLGERAKVTVLPGMISVKGVSRYDESATKFLEQNGFTATENEGNFESRY